MTIDYGTDLACFDDAPSALFPPIDGLGLIRQEMYHRLTVDSVLGWILEDDGTLSPDPSAENWGKDVRRECGAPHTAASAAALGPQYAAVIQRSGRVATADIAVTRTILGNGMVALDFAITG